MTKDEFVARLKEVGLSKKEFATLTKMHYMSVNNWNNTDKLPPSWIESWLEYYEDAMKFRALNRIFQGSKIL